MDKNTRRAVLLIILAVVVVFTAEISYRNSKLEISLAKECIGNRIYYSYRDTKVSSELISGKIEECTNL